MSDDVYGTVEERRAASKVADACKALNTAISEANFIGVNCKITDIAEDWDTPSNLIVHRMERRMMILPAFAEHQDAESKEG
jgi:hypothetical protein